MHIRGHPRLEGIVKLIEVRLGREQAWASLFERDHDENALAKTVLLLG